LTVTVEIRASDDAKFPTTPYLRIIWFKSRKSVIYALNNSDGGVATNAAGDIELVHTGPFPTDELA